MRLNRLDLTRYGRFSDSQIVFPPPASDTADVTIIYGPNEAGKSTAFSAFLELLFGMKTRDHPYDFRFKRSDLLVGAELDLPNRGSVSLQRNSKKNQSLLDDQGRPLDDTFLIGALHGLRRDDYVERFSLNDEGLRRGGARIAGAQGDLGQLLHAGVSGLTSMATTLDQMSTRADQFHKKSARGSALKLSKDRLVEIGRELRATRLTPERERVVGAAKEKAKAAFDDADTALGTARMREAASNAAQVWYDRTSDIHLINTKLAEFPSGPDLCKGAAEGVASLVATIANNSARIAESNKNILNFANVILDNPADTVAEAIDVELAHLKQLTFDGAPLMMRATTATSDLGKRITDRDTLGDQIDQILEGLSVPKVSATSLVLTSTELENLAQAAQAILTKQNTVVAASDALASAKGQHGQVPPAPHDLSQLQAVWDTWQMLENVSVQQNTITTETARLQTAVAVLPKTWAVLVEAGLPARETLVDIARDMLIKTSSITAAQLDFKTRDADYRMAQAKRQIDETGPSSIDLATTLQTRRLRDAIWVAHRGEFSAKTADEFESAMQSDDDAQASFAVGSDARQQLATSLRDENSAMVLRDNARGTLDGLTDEFDRLIEQSVVLATALGLPQDTRPAAFTDRHAALVLAAQIAAQLGNATAAFQILRDRYAKTSADLAIAAKQVGIDVADIDLPNRVQATLAVQDNVRQTWEAWTRANKEIIRLEGNATQAILDKEIADHTLAALTIALPLAGSTAQGMIIALPHLRNLQRLHSDHEKICLRVNALEGAVAQLCASAERIVALTGDSGDAVTEPLKIVEKAHRRAIVYKNATSLRDNAQLRHTEETTIHKKAIDAVDAAQSELLNWFEGQDAIDLLPAARLATLSERDALRSAYNTHDTARNTARAGVKAVLFDDELALLPDVTRAAAVQQILADAIDTRETSRDAHRDATRFYDEAFDADDRSELATEQATILEELRAGARRAAVARLGVLAAKGALRSLAVERRTTMLRDVEEAFIAITSPAWASVDVWSQSEGEKLVGIQPDGGAVPVEMMSTGTMGQLYFALRVAGYRSFARDLGPLPMILDDIMETFDDGRAKAALQLCADIGRSGQAIIFTHHTHLIDLARDTIPGVNIVNMPR